MMTTVQLFLSNKNSTLVVMAIFDICQNLTCTITKGIIFSHMK